MSQDNSQDKSPSDPGTPEANESRNASGGANSHAKSVSGAQSGASTDSTKGTTKGTTKGSTTGTATDSSAVAASAPGSAGGTGKRKESGIAQPVDALRQPAGSTANQETSSTTAAKTPPKADPDSAAKTDPSPNPSRRSTPHTNTTGSTSAMDSNKQASTSKPPSSRGIWGGIFLGLVLVAVALAAGLWWQQQRFESVAREVATRLQQSDKLMTQVRDNANQALSLANAQREVVDQLSRELSVTSNELKTLQQAWASANEGLDQTLLLNDLERLINMANQELVLFGNVNSAVSILSSVNAMLKNQSAPSLKTLQQAVTTDLARLRSVPQVDVASLSAKLDSLIQLTGKAPLLSPSGQQASTAKSADPSKPDAAGAGQGQTPQASSLAESKPWWQSWDTASEQVGQWTSEASTTLMREFADVMSIRKADDPQALLLSEEQAIQLRANVRAMLLSAQLALMTRQADIWRSELNEVQSLLNTRYDTDALDTKASLGLLNELIAAPVATDMPQISQTLSALALAKRALTIPDRPSREPADPQAKGRANDKASDKAKLDTADQTSEPGMQTRKAQEKEGVTDKQAAQSPEPLRQPQNPAGTSSSTDAGNTDASPTISGQGG